MLRAIGREVVLFIACAVFTGAVGLILLDSWLMPRYVRKGQQIEVPNLIDRTPVQARLLLARKGLRLKLREPRWDTEIPKGHLIAQHPPANARVKQGRTVLAVPSKGRRSFTVPNLVRKTLRQAGLLAPQAGLAVGEIHEEPSHDIPEGSVIRHEPPSGAQVAGGTGIILFVSDGPPGVIIRMAKLVGVPIREARRKLEALGLRVGKIRYEFTTAYAPNIVIRQVPADTMDVRQGSRVELVISKL